MDAEMRGVRNRFLVAVLVGAEVGTDRLSGGKMSAAAQ